MQSKIMIQFVCKGTKGNKCGLLSFIEQFGCHHYGANGDNQIVGVWIAIVSKTNFHFYFRFTNNLR